jgi:hypothetical protein
MRARDLGRARDSWHFRLSLWQQAKSSQRHEDSFACGEFSLFPRPSFRSVDELQGISRWYCRSGLIEGFAGARYQGNLAGRDQKPVIAIDQFVE